MSYVCEFPVSNEEQTIINEYRVANTNDNKSQNEVSEIHSGLIFDNPTFKVEELSVSVFPNPAVEYFYVHTNKTNENSKMMMYNINGSIVLEKDLNNIDYLKINTKNLPKGLYLVLVNNKNSASHLTKLIIK